MKTINEVVSDVRQHVQEVSVEVFAALNSDDTILIDVREHEEFVQGHIKNAVNFPRGVLEFKLNEHPSVSHHCETKLALDELAQRDIYLICRTGGRSALAANALKTMGFERVFSVAGGMQQWHAAALPISS